jgi:hypothetical protein
LMVRGRGPYEGKYDLDLIIASVDELLEGVYQIADE